MTNIQPLPVVIAAPDDSHLGHCSCCCCSPDVNLRRSTAIFGKDGSQVFEAVHLFDLYSLRGDLCCAVAFDEMSCHNL